MLLVDVPPGSFGVSRRNDGITMGRNLEENLNTLYVTILLAVWDEHALYGSLRLWMYIKGLIVVYYHSDSVA